MTVAFILLLKSFFGKQKAVLEWVDDTILIVCIKRILLLEKKLMTRKYAD